MQPYLVASPPRIYASIATPDSSLCVMTVRQTGPPGRRCNHIWTFDSRALACWLVILGSTLYKDPLQHPFGCMVGWTFVNMLPSPWACPAVSGPCCMLDVLY